MSIVSQLIAAFKKGAEGKDPNWPPPNTGPRDVPGSDSPQDDGREFRNPPEDPLPPTGTGGVQPPVASGNNADTKAPPEPLPPSEPGPIEGDGGGTPTPPSAPFNPVEVVFKAADGGSASLDFKIADSPVVEDPDAGGEVADRKADIDSAFVRRLRFSPDTEPSVQSSDPEEGGEVAGSGSGLERGIPEGHVPGGGAGERGIPEGHVSGSGAGERGIPEGHVPGGGAGERGIPEGHVPGELTTVPNASLDLHLAEGVDQLVSAEPGSEPRRGNLLTQIDQEGGTDTPPADREGPGDQDSEGEGELVSLGDGRASRLSDERDEGLIGGLKLEGDYKVAGAGPSIASSDPEEGGEVVTRLRSPLEAKGENSGILEDPDAGGEVVSRLRSPLEVRGESSGILEDPDAGGEVFSKVKFKIESADLKFGEYKVEPDYKLEGDWKVEDGIKFEGRPGLPASPPGAPVPYPNVDRDGDDLAESLARKAGEGQKDFFKVKMEEVMVTSARTGGEPLDEQEGEAAVSREAFDGIKGESQDKGHTGEMAFARRTEVKDAHDRFSDTKADTPPKPPAQLIDDDDDFESSSLLDLKPEPDVKEMLPGLAGELPDDAELDFDLDDDLEDTDESEL